MKAATHRRSRRQLLAAALATCAAPWVVRAQPALKVVVVGGGFGGATCARYLRQWAPQVEVTLVEPQSTYVACPGSNRLLAGSFYLRDLARDYAALASAYGVRVLRARAVAIDTSARSLRLDSGAPLSWDRLVLAPGIEFDDQGVEGLAAALDSGEVLHAWRGGSQQIWELRKRIEGMREGGVVALHIPKAPYRCPPGPYERVSLIAHFLQRYNPKAKLLVFDSNADIQSKRDLFRAVWKQYGGMIAYEPNAELLRVGDRGRLLEMRGVGTVRADVINVIPPQRAPALLRRAGLAERGANWCAVDFRTYESALVPGVHVIGDAIASAPGMPKSGHMANQTGKVCAAAIAARALGQPAPEQPVIANTCYSFVSANEAIYVTGVYRFDAAQRTMVPVKEAGGTSAAPNAADGARAIGWVFNILYDSFGSNFALQV
ncbi:MAG: NAD(P)/FAD-dependent oxidoreductase [Burkholderiaceae bacterium]|nr:NAD(P)/FAD-dependent oxidoreductase [Burkholderiaceae bacterium]